jgi:thiol-disulfide isomerase/thioredoxin
MRLTSSVLLFVLVALPSGMMFAADRQKAPELSAEKWLNTEGDKPVSLADLKGQVVLLDFWTYCCINCMHIFPDLHYLEHKYAEQPLVVIGVHSGKFDEEKDADHIRQAILRHNITHPVAVDSQYKIWNAYGVPGWPTLVLIDPEGYAVAGWSGEGHRDEIDARIAELLKEGKRKGALAKPVHFGSERASFKPGVLEFPGKVLADGQGHRLFISDANHNRVLVSDLNGKVGHVIGGGASGLRDGRFRDAEFHQPQGLALSADGKSLYIADTENHALRVADLSRGIVTTIAGTGVQAHRAPADGDARATALSSPWDLARVNEKLYIAMAGVHQIWVMDLNRKTIAVFAGTSREGAVNGKNDDAGFAQPSGLATDGGHLYVADSEASSIRDVTLGEDGQTRTLAGSGELFGFGRRDGIGKAALFQHPLGVALHGDTLFVADTFNGEIRQIDLKTSAVTTWLGSGATDAGTDTAPNFYEPGGLCATNDILYIADTNHHRIVAVDIATRKAHVLSFELPPR